MPEQGASRSIRNVAPLADDQKLVARVPQVLARGDGLAQIGGRPSDRGLSGAERHAVRARSKREDSTLSGGYHLYEMPWLLETIRATVFAPDIKALRLPDWRTLMHTPPSETLNNPEADSTVEAGAFGGQWLTMGLARRPGRGPGRADLILAPLNSTAVVPFADPLQERIEPAAIGPFTTSFPQFMELARRWLSTDTNVRRLALACTLWERASNLDDALDFVLRNVPSFEKVGDDRIFDFLIQLNLPRASRINPSISINRFGQWSVRIVELVLPTRNIMWRPPTIRSPRAQADLDISTPTEAEIAGRQIPDHLEELGRMLIEITEKGHTP